MIKLVILGTGNVATHLFNAFFKAENVVVVQVYGRNKSALKPFSEKTQTTSSFDGLVEADVYLVCVKDDAVKEVISKIPFKDKLIAHTSGSVPLLDFFENPDSRRDGVFYPLQTFSKETEVDFSEIPICLEASEEHGYQTLKSLANNISGKTYKISTEQRKSLHLAAVFACNFTNYMYRIGEKICEENKVPFEILHVLIMETAKKATLNSPEKTQTGPAVRGDEKTIEKHLEQLKDSDFKEIYILLTEFIRRNAMT
jgi:predicted short-subunit dehydrogenase-like oxidoreductase (DUF2520 family)